MVSITFIAHLRNYYKNNSLSILSMRDDCWKFFLSCGMYLFKCIIHLRNNIERVLCFIYWNFRVYCTSLNNVIYRLLIITSPTLNGFIFLNHLETLNHFQLLSCELFSLDISWMQFLWICNPYIFTSHIFHCCTRGNRFFFY